MRMTLSSIPGTSDLLKQARMPFAVLVQPLAPTHPGEEPLQVAAPALTTASPPFWLHLVHDCFPWGPAR